MSAMATQPRTGRKEPLFSLVLSFLIPGLGQLYNGDNDKGLKLILCAVAAYLLTAICIGIFIYPVIWVYAMYDAYTSAEKINRCV
jgi:TM2 domain-containing membrane protein YozV